MNLNSSLVSDDTVTNSPLVLHAASISEDTSSPSTQSRKLLQTVTTNAINTDAFITKWDTTNTSSGSSLSNQIKLPLESTGTYDFSVDWGDGTYNRIVTANYTDAIHTYSTEGQYTLVINGTLVGWRFVYTGDKLKIIEISQWGNMSMGNSESYFYGAENMVILATDVPDLNNTTNLRLAFAENKKLGKTGNFANWDVSHVTNMNLMFARATSFNQDISGWNTSQVTDMGRMFEDVKSFNQPIGVWDTSQVTDMSSLFQDAYRFNQPLNNWNTSQVTTMFQMFLGAMNFDQPLDTWDTSQVTDMSYMFVDAQSFNQSLNKWNVEHVKDLTGTFEYAYSFNQPLDQWNITNVEQMGNMFYNIRLSIVNYDNTLISWASQSVKQNVVFDGGRSFYSDLAIDARNTLTDTFKWKITDAGQAEYDAPTIDHPQDVEIKDGMSYNINWYVNDAHPGQYQIFENGKLIEYGKWHAPILQFYTDYLVIGVYNYTIHIYDELNNTVSDTVIVTVVSSDSSTIDSSENVSLNFEFLLPEILFLIGLQLVNYRRRKKFRQ